MGAKLRKLQHQRGSPDVLALNPATVLEFYPQPEATVTLFRPSLLL